MKRHGPSKPDRDLDEPVGRDPLGDVARISDALEGKTIYVNGRGPLNPFEIEEIDTQHHLALGRASRSRTWEKVGEIRRWYAAYQASDGTSPRGYMTDIQGDVVRIDFERIDDDKALVEILVGIQSTDLELLLDHPAVELVEDDGE